MEVEVRDSREWMDSGRGTRVRGAAETISAFLLYNQEAE